MRRADFVEMTTTSIAGTNGDGAVTCSQITSPANAPTFTQVFGSANTQVEYTIEKTSNGYRESGIGMVASNVLTRTSPTVTYDSSTWADNAPSALAFGSSPTRGDVLIRLAPVSASFVGGIHGQNSVVAGDTTWRDYPLSNNYLWHNSGAGYTLTADREYYMLYYLDGAGVLSGIQYEVTTAQASSNIKLALYPMGKNGMPSVRLVDFVTTSTASTGVKTDTATGSWSPAGAMRLTGGWHIVGFIASHAIALRGMGFSLIGRGRTPFGRHGGYGYASLIYVAGSYSTGLPTTPNLSGGTMVDPGAGNTLLWIGLKVTP